MPIIQFSHANGFPAKTYSVLFSHLQEYEISAINVLAEKVKSDSICWLDMVEELLENVSQAREPVVGVGHSLGAILTLLAAAKRPELFKSVILLDPPLFSTYKRLLIGVFRALKLENLISPSGKSAKRRDVFTSKEQALRYFQANRFFVNFHPNSLKDYVENGLITTAKGVELLISKDKEVAIFHKLLLTYPDKIKSVVGTCVYAVNNPIIWNSDLKWINYYIPKMEIIPFPGTHFFPLEYPLASAKLIGRIINALILNTK